MLDQQVDGNPEQKRDEAVHLAVDTLGQQAGRVEEHKQRRAAQGDGRKEVLRGLHPEVHGQDVEQDAEEHDRQRRHVDLQHGAEQVRVERSVRRDEVAVDQPAGERGHSLLHIEHDVAARHQAKHQVSERKDADPRKREGRDKELEKALGAEAEPRGHPPGDNAGCPEADSDAAAQGDRLNCSHVCAPCRQGFSRDASTCLPTVSDVSAGR